MEYSISNQNMKVTVSDSGAELISVIAGGKEWIWQNPTGDWSGHSPVLFPVCGHCGVKHKGVQYPIGAHGFCKRTPFALAAQGEDYLDFSLASNENTKKVYPFDFVFHVVYRIHGSCLTVEYVVENTGKETLYFACGSHESFNLEQNLDGYRLVFDKDEQFVYHLHNDDGFMTGETLNVGAGKVFDIPRDFLQESRSIIFKGLQSRGLCLQTKDGKTLAKLRFDGFANLLLWRAADAPYICIEPWTCLPDAANVPDVEFSEKYGTIAVAAGEKKTMTHSIEYV